MEVDKSDDLVPYVAGRDVGCHGVGDTMHAVRDRDNCGLGDGHAERG